MITYAAYSAIWRALFDARVEAARAVLGASALRAFIIGFNVLFFGLIIIAILSSAAAAAPVLWLPALAVLIMLLIAAGVGLSAFAQNLGERLLPQSSGLRQHLVSAAMLYCGCLLPFAGWFVLLPYVLCVSVGAFLLSMRRARNI
jgi:hypothetical protein